MTLQLGIVGFGKIARDQHVAAIARTSGVELCAIASRNATFDGVANYPDIAAMLAGETELHAVALCQPPQARFDAACAALRAGKHVFLEKPPGASVSEVEALVRLARENGVTLFASWHSRCAAGIAPAKAWLAGRKLRNIAIAWKEDVRHWHPGQDWIFAPGGFGVFDPGVNALSILTEIVDEPVRLIAAKMEIPSNRHAPIAARLALATLSGAPIEAEFDFRQTGPQLWDIVVETESGRLALSMGGAQLSIDGVSQEIPQQQEYEQLYARFIDMIHARRSDVDLAPLQITADAFLRATMRHCAPFEF